MCSSSCLLAIIAIIFPPLPVWIRRGLCSADSLINIALCVLGFLPGLIHAWYIISVTPEDYEVAVREGYVAVPAHFHQDVERGAARGYGTVPAQPQPHVQPYSDAAPSAGSSSQQQQPPAYHEAIQGDNKIQHK